MTDITKQAKASIAELMQSNEEQLYEELGIRAKELARNPGVAGSFAPQITFDMKAMGPMEEIRKFGRRLFKRWLVEAYKLLCGSDPADEKDRKEVAKALSVDATTVGALVAALLISQLGMAPAIAAVVAAIVAKRFFNPAYEEFCRMLGENLPKE